MKKNTVLGSLIAALLAGSVGGVGYKVILDRQADVFEDSVHQVVRVIDGDTIDLENDVRVRLLGIDTPESNDCFGPQATSYVTLLLEDAHVHIEKDISGADTFDRILRYVYVPSDDIREDDLFVNQHLVREGYAVTMAEAPDNRYRDLFSSAQQHAKDNQKGMWATCDMSEHVSDLREIDTQAVDPSCDIKGNISEKAYGRNYFLPGCPNYNRIKIDTRKGEAYFCTEAEALAADFTRSASCDNVNPPSDRE
jgi:endonuclease YncB( thermonuclease family)